MLSKRDCYRYQCLADTFMNLYPFVSKSHVLRLLLFFLAFNQTVPGVGIEVLCMLLAELLRVFKFYLSNSIADTLENSLFTKWRYVSFSFPI